MATNNNGHLLDSAGNVAVDFVWGNLPIQPNDVRTNLLDYRLDSHINADSGWSGYPQFLPNTTGADVLGSTDYILVPNVIGLTTALAVGVLKGAGFTTPAGVSTVTTGAATANAAISYTVVTRTAGSFDATITAVAAVAQYPVGSQITATGTVAGTFTVKSVSSTNLVTFTTTASTVLTAGTGTVVAVVGTIKTQSVAPAAATTIPGSSITVTPYDVAS